jgi:hypothetical protein
MVMPTTTSAQAVFLSKQQLLEKTATNAGDETYNSDFSGWDVSQVTDHADFSTNWGSGNTEPIWP